MVHQSRNRHKNWWNRQKRRRSAHAPPQAPSVPPPSSPFNLADLAAAVPEMEMAMNFPEAQMEPLIPSATPSPPSPSTSTSASAASASSSSADLVLEEGMPLPDPYNFGEMAAALAEVALEVGVNMDVAEVQGGVEPQEVIQVDEDELVGLFEDDDS